MKSIKTIVSISSFCLLLTACGGSESTNDTGSGVKTPGTPALQSTTEGSLKPTTTTDTRSTISEGIPITAERIEDINVESDNTLSATFELTLTVTGANEKIYISLCDEFTQDQGHYGVQYASCLFKTPITKNSYSRTLKVANHNTDLILAIWYYDGRDPTFVRWQKSQHDENVLNVTL